MENTVPTFHKFAGPLIVVDFGVAIRFEAVSAKGEYLSGAIALAIGISIAALAHQTAKLPRIELVTPRSVIDKDTIEWMQSGIINIPHLTLNGLKIIYDRMLHR